MATSPSRRWRAACPNCGAPVEFASAASASAVCGYCRSTLLRDGDALRRIGVVAELFDDHSPLQPGASGRFQGVDFTVVGRLQYGTLASPRASASPAPPPEGAAGPTGRAGSDLAGTWNEWHALFDNGPNPKSGWLSEDNGAYVFAFDAPLQEAPAAESLHAGQRVMLGGQAWDVASVVRARIVSAQGELPSPPPLEREFVVVDLRNAAGEVGTLDFADPARPAWSVGRAVLLSDLALSGLRDASEMGEKTLASRALACPSCGAALAPTLASTQSLSCAQCRAVVAIAAGAGADLAHYAQNNSGPGGLEPQIPLGRSGTLALGGPPLAWQVVGYLERCTLPAAGDDEQFYWREYLLYERLHGFVFLVDADDGWSWVRPITGVPTLRGPRAQWQGDSYLERERYDAQVTWVQGEFYWRVRRDEQAQVVDYAGTGLSVKKRLSREQAGAEVTWSAGATLDAAAVAQAFGLPPAAQAALQRDVKPLSSNAGVGRALIIFVAVVALIWLAQRLDRDDCADVRATFGAASTEYQQCQRNAGSGVRSGGGSFGGWSGGGGGHK